MKINAKLLIIFGIILAPLMCRAERLCVLVFDMHEGPFSKAAFDVFRESIKEGKTRVVSAALPSQILECAQRGAEEIIIIAHAGRLRSHMANLVYIAAIPEEDREQRIQESLLVATQAYRNGKNNFEKNRALAEIQKCELTRKNHLPMYEKPAPILPHAFAKLADYVTKQREGRRLRKIRMLNCLEASVENRYQDSFNKLREAGVEFDYAPINIFMSILKLTPEGVVSFNKKWLAKSLENLAFY